MSKTENKENQTIKLSYIETICSQIKKYEDSITVSPLIPSSFQETNEPENITSLIQDSFIGASSGSMLDIVMAKIKNIESLQKVNPGKINNSIEGKTSEQKSGMADIVHKYTESLDIEEIKAAVKSNNLFEKQKTF